MKTKYSHVDNTGSFLFPFYFPSFWHCFPPVFFFCIFPISLSITCSSFILLYFIVITILFFSEVKKKQNVFQAMENRDKISVEVQMVLNPSSGWTAALWCETTEAGIVSAFSPVCTTLEESQTLHTYMVECLHWVSISAKAANS